MFFRLLLKREKKKIIKPATKCTAKYYNTNKGLTHWCCEALLVYLNDHYYLNCSLFFNNDQYNAVVMTLFQWFLRCSYQTIMTKKCNWNLYCKTVFYSLFINVLINNHK